jgi:dipeptide/tripeptide permease
VREAPSSGAPQPPRRAATAPVENRVAIAVGALTLIAGVVVLAVASGTGATIAAAMLLGIAGIAFVSLIFLIVGQSEETDRRRHPRG